MSRLDLHEYLDARFDHATETANKAVYICTTPRTASFSLCRHFSVLGWGVPHEYYSTLVAQSLLARWQPGSELTPKPEKFTRYGMQLLQKRSRNGIYGAKLMASQMRFFDMVHPTGFDRDMSTGYVFLYRKDFAAQIASFITAAITNRWSFSDSEVRVAELNFAIDEVSVRRACELVIKNEAFWIDFFASKGTKPVQIAAEVLVKAPGPLLEKIARKFSLSFEKSALELSIAEETGKPYEKDQSVKADILSRFGDLIVGLSSLRPAWPAE